MQSIFVVTKLKNFTIEVKFVALSIQRLSSAGYIVTGSNLFKNLF